MSMQEPFIAYTVLWTAACAAAAVLVLRDPARYALTQPAYREFLFAPWKVATFIVAGGGITLIAPYTDDPTWDRVDGCFMSVLTFLTAPWTVGVLFRAVRGQLPPRQVFVAVCAWLFSASWSYDLYLVLRDGRYPETWLPNLFASSFLYLLAGMFWNLDWRSGRGVSFAFSGDLWPQPPAPGAAGRIIWYALPFMVIAAILILQFLFPVR